jgi:hypothetical protein
VRNGILTALSSDSRYNGIHRKAVIAMEATIISTRILPMPIRDIIHTPKASVTERDGGVMLLPIVEPNTRPTKLFGMFAGSGLSSEDFSQQKNSKKN